MQTVDWAYMTSYDTNLDDFINKLQYKYIVKPSILLYHKQVMIWDFSIADNLYIFNLKQIKITDILTIFLLFLAGIGNVNQKYNYDGDWSLLQRIRKQWTCSS